MFSKINSAGIRGVKGYPVSVEADVSDGLPGYAMVGYLSAEVREAQERIRTAIRNSGFCLSAKKVTINLSPADIRKEGTVFDLAIAAAVMCSYGVIESMPTEQDAFVGEVGLDGRVKAVKGILSMVEALKNAGVQRCFLPKVNVLEGTVIKGMEIVGVETVREMEGFLNRGNAKGKYYNPDCISHIGAKSYSVDFAEVNGQHLLKRATEVAVAGMHNILYIGAAGTGKTMIAKRIPTIMPSISLEESIEISKIYSICGLLPEQKPLVWQRPFRSPHHSITAQALIGGGVTPKPGEISLASQGVLFLDELPEFKASLDLLRQPMEEKRVVVSRMHGSYEFPANCMVGAAMNPCKCGFYPDRSRCSCTDQQVRRYLNRVSRPLLDRFDICVESGGPTYEELTGVESHESSAVIRERVESVRRLQRERLEGTGIYFNSEMGEKELKAYCCLSGANEGFMRQVYETLGLSPRTYNKILKVARTIADLEGRERIERKHLSEAVGYCSLKEKYWGR